MSKELESSLQEIKEQYEEAQQQVNFWQQRFWYLKGKMDALAEQQQKVEKPKKKK